MVEAYWLAARMRFSLPSTGSFSLKLCCLSRPSSVCPQSCHAMRAATMTSATSHHQWTKKLLMAMRMRVGRGSVVPMEAKLLTKVGTAFIMMTATTRIATTMVNKG